MTGSYNWVLVFASYCVAVIAAYTAIYFGTRVFDLTGASRRFWLGCGAICLGTGIWSMHFVGMSAYNMPMQMEMTFNAGYTLLSWVPAALASALALYVITLPNVSIKGIGASAVIMGAGIFAMHYGGMYAMQMEPGIQYDLLLVVASGVIAVVASGAALVICRKVRDVPKDYVLIVKITAALVMGAAICGMHYTGMAAASYPMGAEVATSNSLRGDWMGIPTAVVASLFLLLAVFIAYHDFREIERSRKEKQQQQKIAEHTAFYDSATGLGNRTYMESKVLERLQVPDGKKAPPAFKLFYFELSDYRELSQTEGEKFSQAMAVHFASKLRQHLSGAEDIARYSTNSFMAIVPAVDPIVGKSILQPLVDSLRKPAIINGKSIYCNWGLGFSEYPKSGSNSRNLIRAAQKVQLKFTDQESEWDLRSA